jgi:hypothetical protein
MTCGGDRGDECHRAYQEIHGGDLGELIHDGTGLACPACGWKQPPPVGHQLADTVRQLAAAQQRIVELKALCAEAAGALQAYWAGYDFDAWAMSWGKGQPHPGRVLLEKLRSASEYRPVIVRPIDASERVPGNEAP